MISAAHNPENPNRATVRRAIGYGRQAYENHIHKYFVTWCEKMALRFYHSDRDLINDERLFRWYCGQWERLVETAILQDYGGYMKAKIPDTHAFFYKIMCEYAESLEKYYPASLIRKPAKVKKSKFTINLN